MRVTLTVERYRALRRVLWTLPRGVLACGPSLHVFDLFFRRATPSRRFGVTSARHDERAARAPW